MNESPTPTPASIDEATLEELTAYLDGELEPGEVSQVEQRLSIDADYRRELHRLQRTWDLLEQVSDGPVDDQFTRTTMEMVAHNAMGEQAQTASKWLTNPLRAVAMVGLPLAMVVISFATVRHFQRAPVDELIQNLPVVENADHYLLIDQDYDFLQQLERSGLFADESALYSREHDVIAPETPKESSSEERELERSLERNLARLDSLDNEQRQALFERRSRFQALSDTRQQVLIAFHDRIVDHARTENLLDALHQYYDWLGTLNLDERARLMDLPVDERIDEIARIRTLQARQEFGRTGTTRLPFAADAEAVFDWYEKVSAANSNQIRQQFVNLVLIENMDAGRTITQRKMNRLVNRPLNQLIAVLIRFDREFIEDLLYRNFQRLRPELSEEANEILLGQTEENQKMLLLRWIMAANQIRSHIDEAQLQAFYEELPAADRDEIDKMADWGSELRRRYRETQLSDSSSGTVLPDEEEWKSLLEATGLGTEN